MEKFQLAVLFKIIGIGSASGLVYHENKLYLISDNSTFLFEYSFISNKVTKIPLLDNAEENIRKKDKPDFESITLSNDNLILLGSGSKTNRNSIITYMNNKWIAINGCNSTPTITDLPDIANDRTTIKQKVYSGGTNGSEVVSYVVLNGGHTWPQGYQYLNEAIIGKTSQDMNACEVIWTFFKRFKR